MASIFKPTGRNSHYVEFLDIRGRLRRVRGFKDKAATKELANKIERAVAIRQGGGILAREMLKWLEGLRKDIIEKLAEFGVIDKQRAAAGKAILHHIKEWEEMMKAKGRTPQHTRKYKSAVTRLVNENGWRSLSDITPQAAQKWLGSLRDNGAAPNTINDYVRAMKAFCKWLMVVKRVSENPLAYIVTVNTRVDRRIERRALTQEEIAKLLSATEAAGKHHGMTGHQRALLYRLAMETGLRWNELRSLTKSSFTLTNVLTCVTVAADDAKGGKDDTLPLRVKLAEDLKRYLAFLPPDAPTFPMWKDRGADMIRRDLKAAGIAIKDEYGKILDFHALRHTFGSMLAAAGVHPKVAQDLMRHSTIELTMSIYTHTLYESRLEALHKLPDFEAQSDNFQGDNKIAET